MIVSPEAPVMQKKHWLISFTVFVGLLLVPFVPPSFADIKVVKFSVDAMS
jgi:hypothetical protein